MGTSPSLVGTLLAAGGEVVDVQVIAVIGVGGSSPVFWVKHRGRDRALKLDARHATAEASVSMDLHHDMFVSVDPEVYTTLDGQKRALMMDLVEGVDCVTLAVEAAHRFDRACVSDFLARVCAAFDAVKSTGFVLKDLKPDHLLVIGTGSIRIIDFETSRTDPDEDEEVVTSLISGVRSGWTNGYRAKDVKRGPPSDIYSLGVVGLQLIERRPYRDPKKLPEFLLWQEDAKKRLRTRIQLATAQKKQDEVELENVLRRMLDDSPKLRPTAANVVARLATRSGLDAIAEESARALYQRRLDQDPTTVEAQARACGLIPDQGLPTEPVETLVSDRPRPGQPQAPRLIWPAVALFLGLLLGLGAVAAAIYLRPATEVPPTLVEVTTPPVEVNNEITTGETTVEQEQTQTVEVGGQKAGGGSSGGRVDPPGTKPEGSTQQPASDPAPAGKDLGEQLENAKNSGQVVAALDAADEEDPTIVGREEQAAIAPHLADLDVCHPDRLPLLTALLNQKGQEEPLLTECRSCYCNLFTRNAPEAVGGSCEGSRQPSRHNGKVDCCPKGTKVLAGTTCGPAWAHACLGKC